MSDDLIRQDLHDQLLDREPIWGARHEPLLARARLRARRRAVIGAAAAVAVVATASAGLSSAHRHDARPIETASDTAMADYDPASMPSLLETKLRAALGSEVSGADPARFVAEDQNYAALPPSGYNQAVFMYVDIGDPRSRVWRLYVGREGSETEAVAPDFCVSGLAAGWMLSCEISRAAGTETIAYTDVGTLVPRVGGYQMADWRKLSTGDLPSVRLERQVKVIHDDGYSVSTREQVFGPSSLDPNLAFQASASALADLAGDPSIVIAKPSSG